MCPIESRGVCVGGRELKRKGGVAMRCCDECKIEEGRAFYASATEGGAYRTRYCGANQTESGKMKVPVLHVKRTTAVNDQGVLPNEPHRDYSRSLQTRIALLRIRFGLLREQKATLSWARRKHVHVCGTRDGNIRTFEHSSTATTELESYY